MDGLMSNPTTAHARKVMTASASEEWYTPTDLIERVRAFYGGRIDLDPASCEIAQDTVGAAYHYTLENDGLRQPWRGNVWCNPPYGRHTALFVEKALVEYESGSVTQCLLLLKAATDTRWFAPLFRYPICFIRGRVRFYTQDGEMTASAPFPSVIVYLGANKEGFAQAFKGLGSVGFFRDRSGDESYQYVKGEIGDNNGK